MIKNPDFFFFFFFGGGGGGGGGSNWGRGVVIGKAGGGFTSFKTNKRYNGQEPKPCAKYQNPSLSCSQDIMYTMFFYFGIEKGA